MHVSVDNVALMQLSNVVQTYSVVGRLTGLARWPALGTRISSSYVTPAREDFNFRLMRLSRLASRTGRDCVSWRHTSCSTTADDVHLSLPPSPSPSTQLDRPLTIKPDDEPLSARRPRQRCFAAAGIHC